MDYGVSDTAGGHPARAAQYRAIKILLAGQSADLGLVGYEMAVLVRRFDEHLGVSPRAPAASGGD